MRKRPRYIAPPPAGSLWLEQAAEYIGVAKTTLYKWRQTGYGPQGYPNPRRIAYEITVLDAWLDRQKALAPAA
ncbi:helix-turn-helix transcriptional regulator [Streptomyces sp. NPDC001389]|uniref:helix-turn-helix transcriptional regulator n=1 Tax=Streptomyces sp. NPDC001389 TaxID=3364569 RepID=UPI0036A3D2C6